LDEEDIIPIEEEVILPKKPATNFFHDYMENMKNVKKLDEDILNVIILLIIIRGYIMICNHVLMKYQMK